MSIASPLCQDNPLPAGQGCTGAGTCFPQLSFKGDEKPWEGRCGWPGAGALLGAGVGVDCFLATSLAPGLGRPEMPSPVAVSGSSRDAAGSSVLRDLDSPPSRNGASSLC